MSKEESYQALAKAGAELLKALKETDYSNQDDAQVERVASATRAVLVVGRGRGEMDYGVRGPVIGPAIGYLEAARPGGMRARAARFPHAGTATPIEPQPHPGPALDVRSGTRTLVADSPVLRCGRHRLRNGMYGNESHLIQGMTCLHPRVSDHVGHCDQGGCGGRLFVDITPTLPGGLACHTKLDGNLRPRLAMLTRNSHRLQLSMFQRAAHCADIRQRSQRTITIARTIRVTTQPIPRLPAFVPGTAEKHAVRLP